MARRRGPQAQPPPPSSNSRQTRSRARLEDDPTSIPATAPAPIPIPAAVPAPAPTPAAVPTLAAVPAPAILAPAPVPARARAAVSAAGVGVDAAPCKPKARRARKKPSDNPPLASPSPASAPAPAPAPASAVADPVVASPHPPKAPAAVSSSLAIPVGPTAVKQKPRSTQGDPSGRRVLAHSESSKPSTSPNIPADIGLASVQQATPLGTAGLRGPVTPHPTSPDKEAANTLATSLARHETGEIAVYLAAQPEAVLADRAGPADNPTAAPTTTSALPAAFITSKPPMQPSPTKLVSRYPNGPQIPMLQALLENEGHAGEGSMHVFHSKSLGYDGLEDAALQDSPRQMKALKAWSLASKSSAPRRDFLLPHGDEDGDAEQSSPTKRRTQWKHTKSTAAALPTPAVQAMRPAATTALTNSSTAFMRSAVPDVSLHPSTLAVSGGTHAAIVASATPATTTTSSTSDIHVGRPPSPSVAVGNGGTTPSCCRR
ncbi:uncharacterized protein BXZ73DRAFT_83022 [Epithele typhae]|uniref:uncharacterized protein n=1 Tax=Epithele typhae TaxID=378194 RepID=UPI002008A853|nr:uncharacterized protein BXZ73DRAFT_83022 [Epithele typhae]KAH9911026.1 hypothetical protein BXZ73DRAFT_83022 [Epithele typhae]